MLTAPRSAAVIALAPLLLGLSSWARGAEPRGDAARPEPNSRLAQLVEQLASPRYGLREAAVKELAERHDAAPILRWALRSRDPDVVRQAQRALTLNEELKQKRSLERALRWGRAGRVDLMIDALVLWDGPSNSLEYWQSIVDIARVLAKPADNRYLTTFKWSQLERKNSLLLRNDIIDDPASRALQALPYSETATLGDARMGDWIGYARCERARVNSHARASVIVASDSVEIPRGHTHCILLTNGDITTGQLSYAIVICGGAIRAPEGSGAFRLDGSLAVARRWEPNDRWNDFQNSVLLCAETYKRPPKTCNFAVEKSIIEDGKPFDFIRSFDPTEVGVRVKATDLQVVVDRVAQAKPFAQAGLKAGDIVIEIDGKKVDTPERFRALVRQGVVREKASVKYQRDGRTVVVNVALPEIPEYLPPPRVAAHVP